MRTLGFIYLVGALLVALRFGWHMRYRLDKYDWRYSDVWSSFWFSVVLWPLYLLAPGSLIHPTFTVSAWHKGRAEKERALDGLAQNLPPCGAMIRYAPEHDESGECDSEFFFNAAEIEAIMAKRLAELPVEQHGRFADILKWLRQRDDAIGAPTGVPAPWNGHFVKVAIGMMRRGLGTVVCGKCGEAIPHDQIALEWAGLGLIRTCGWSYRIWMCPQGHKLLTRESMHLYIKSTDAEEPVSNATPSLFGDESRNPGKSLVLGVPLAPDEQAQATE